MKIAMLLSFYAISECNLSNETRKSLTGESSLTPIKGFTVLSQATYCFTGFVLSTEIQGRAPNHLFLVWRTEDFLDFPPARGGSQVFVEDIYSE